MTSVADSLRAATLARVRALPVEVRIGLALSLGDADVDVYARSSGLPRDEARARLRASRQHGRAPSVAEGGR
jgi:hypothetical protein